MATVLLAYQPGLRELQHYRFWHFEALRAFREAARLDPACAMCQWGIHRAMEFGGSSEDELKAVVNSQLTLQQQIASNITFTYITPLNSSNTEQTYGCVYCFVFGWLVRDHTGAANNRFPSRSTKHSFVLQDGRVNVD